MPMHGRTVDATQLRMCRKCSKPVKYNERTCAACRQSERRAATKASAERMARAVLAADKVATHLVYDNEGTCTMCGESGRNHPDTCPVAVLWSAVLDATPHARQVLR